ncbi:precorrin-6Y C5,15-methyltransferase (decarboxylating) subunit CbiT [Selenomonas sputigena]|uniref:Precorrin-6Y C5,15-methyltransferase (Decarboxylating) subunit CbiT n=1 Tax=Selenomonas sputigena TaxID=69823 RepID=A0ABV3X1Y8_9FIRM
MKHFLGIEDEEFIRGKAPMTKKEIRILTLAGAKIGKADIVCDIGAGTGSLSIEAALLAKEGHVYAVERKAEAAALIRQNAEKFGVENLTIIENEAPKGLEQLPERIDAAIIGGTGSRLEEILDFLDARLKPGGFIVINCITVQTLASSLAYMRKKRGYLYDTVQVQVNRLRKIGPYDMAEAINPVYIISCHKANV